MICGTALAESKQTSEYDASILSVFVNFSILQTHMMGAKSSSCVWPTQVLMVPRYVLAGQLYAYR